MAPVYEPWNAARGAEIIAEHTHLVQISPSNGPSDWQKAYDEQARHSRRIAPSVEAAE
jgi:hypothetical protein